MKHCVHCGNQLTDKAVVCVVCGRSPGKASAHDDKKSFKFAFWSFLFPLVGIVLYLVWKDKYPLKARSSLRGAIWGVITALIVAIALIVLMAMGIYSILDSDALTTLYYILKLILLFV